MANDPDTWCWNELNTRDTAKATSFYTHVFDWEAKKAGFEGMDYTEWQNAGVTVGGMMEMAARGTGRGAGPLARLLRRVRHRRQRRRGRETGGHNLRGPHRHPPRAFRRPRRPGRGHVRRHKGQPRLRSLPAVVVMSGMALLAGCGGGYGHAAGGPPTTSMTSTTSTTALRTASCRTDRITATASHGSEAGGHGAAIVVFTNGGSTSCTMEGYPTAWLVDATGARVGPMSVDEVNLASTTVSFPPGGHATTTVWYDNPQVTSPPCPTIMVAGIEVVPPGQSTGLVADLAITVCISGNVLGTTPVTPGTTESAF